MPQDWKNLVELVGQKPFLVERVRLSESKIAIEGEFELPPLIRLNSDDQVFVAAFIQTHGSIKEMERLFGISYPTVKSRLNRIASQLGGAIVENTDREQAPSKNEILEKIERGELKVAEALELLK
ncbi:MAG: RNA polymerase subunit sigma-70 [Bdellovibrio sp. CG12_big_fil_rev_8_21_14_0_65_39_13]|nr:MAG: RNA polymerase subunit sigma-70 [Bdellovibrio sp. CG22_combo_CG10-13_8_21_14_all_39_27]PIQ58759.1 MAG: RNA polymerase subunit sigma-70 [Bdellovibrio sp. CG12_big_fil_rev_8_21_14_0_65_39_13]PIR35560.1 MAG: RNA polymerase subunit sigma-70 [Bdellovibrio sp. CG11_big_fil_rev_8_21_14_0_20_39_38]PJB54314.1 MAG: RNA polymerase subunit sigma-70 [Bdellovibrio sp. CG_4_9_14_3_um_filter_39_7]